jgi:2-keto-4-pentenoate hydratase
MGSIGGAADKRLKTLIMKLNPQLRQGMQPYEHTSSARFLGNPLSSLLYFPSFSPKISL